MEDQLLQYLLKSISDRLDIEVLFGKRARLVLDGKVSKHGIVMEMVSIGLLEKEARFVSNQIQKEGQVLEIEKI